MSEAYHQLGQLLLKQGQGNEAAVCYSEAVKHNRSDSKSYYLLGQILAAKQDWERAIACYQKSISLKSDHAPSHHHLGDAYLKTQQLKEALLDLYLREIQKNPGDLDNYRQALAITPQGVLVTP